MLRSFSFVASDAKPITNTGKIQKWERVLEVRCVVLRFFAMFEGEQSGVVAMIGKII